MYCFFYKILNGYINIDLSPFIQFFSHSERYSLRGRNELALRKNYARSDTFIFSYFNSIVDTWNMLPLSTRRASSICSFKKGVRDFLSNV